MHKHEFSVSIDTLRASWNLEIWDFGNLEIWGPENPEILRFGDLEIQNFGIQQIKKMKSLKNQIRSAQNVGKVWISRKKSPRPYLGLSEAIFSMDRTNQKMPTFCLFSMVGQWANALDGRWIRI